MRFERKCREEGHCLGNDASGKVRPAKVRPENQGTDLTSSATGLQNRGEPRGKGSLLADSFYFLL